MKFQIYMYPSIEVKFTEEEFKVLDKLFVESGKYEEIIKPGPGAWWNGCRYNTGEGFNRLNPDQLEIISDLLIEAKELGLYVKVRQIIADYNMVCWSYNEPVVKKDFDL